MYLYRALYSYYCSRLIMDQNNNGIHTCVVCVATTGVVGLLLLKGKTADSFFAVPLDATVESKLGASSEQACLLPNTQLILWNEVYVQYKDVVDIVDKCLRDITKVNSLFSGIPLVLGENWAQSLPVVPRGSCSNIVNACLQ